MGGVQGPSDRQVEEKRQGGVVSRKVGEGRNLLLGVEESKRVTERVGHREEVAVEG